ncbi:DUF6933 domain-containing protein [Pseudomonas sp. CT11-2]|uniref:DUF6933 domain-containing protein n=1 Tax=unclassified Pseudomonas TaxID=196821 RepID=UPI00215FCCEA|nr:hypothetical protein [Pseudomonas sp. B21-019]UVM34353.1 hypothetical protein LOY36_06470 [Pseudomonas sp. B21-019]
MLIFNCTEAASTFFSRVHKGKKITPVEKPPSSVIEDDEQGDSAEQWLVHAITVQRKHVLFVIHVKTRYCMIFADAKKADVEGFVQRFSERWINGLMRDALRHDVLQWVGHDAMLERFNESRQYRLYKRGHRSAQGHINEIAWIFEDYAAEWGCLPPDEIMAGRFDAQMNDTVRSNNGVKGYYLPDEEMMAHWLRQYCGLDEAGIQAARDRREEVRRQIWALEATLSTQDQLLQ